MVSLTATTPHNPFFIPLIIDFASASKKSKLAPTPLKASDSSDVDDIYKAMTLESLKVVAFHFDNTMRAFNRSYSPT